ncbi:MAG: hypothetical protein ACREQ5_20390, partial [Candidatus Dormibacteria bacterium]
SHRIAERLARRLVPGYGRCQPVERVCLSAPSGTTEPESTEPESTEPESTEPESTEPESTELSHR